MSLYDENVFNYNILFLIFAQHIKAKGCFMNINIKKVAIGMAAGFVNGLFGSGGGTLAVAAFEKFLKIEPHKSHATVIALILPLSIISAFVYLKKVEIEWMSVLWVSVGGIIGGYIGASVLNKIPVKWLHRIFGAFMIAAAVRMML